MAMWAWARRAAPTTATSPHLSLPLLDSVALSLGVVQPFNCTSSSPAQLQQPLSLPHWRCEVMSDPAVSGFVQTTTSGGGEYNEHSAAQHAAAKGTLALLPQAMAAVRSSLPLQDGAETGAAVTVVDYGCSEGRNSVRHMTAIVDALRSTAGGGLTTRTPVIIVHNDQPHNDWASLTRTISLSPLGSTLRDNVFSLCSPRSFYRQILPNSTVHVGWASASSHWLSALPPARLPNAVFSYAETDSSAKDVWCDYAQHDWSAFLAARASELVTGGVLLLSCLLSEPPTGYSPPVGEDEPLWKILRRLERAGQLSSDDLHRINLPVYYRTREETCGESVLAPHGLQLLACETRLFKDSPPKLEYRQHGDVALFARQQAAILRTTGAAMFVAAFGQAKAELFFQQLEAFIREDPECCDFYLPMGFLLLQKSSSARARQPSTAQQQQQSQPV